MILKKIRLNKFVTLNNRVIISPMCQYSGNSGSPSNWHYQHLGRLALSGAGMLMVESTSVSKEGMITYKDLALYNHSQEKNFLNIFKYIKKLSNIPVGIQISHSGRKGSSHVPWIKANTPLSKKEKRWITFAPSSIKKDAHWPLPSKLTIPGIEKIKNDFKNTCLRAKKIGFDCLEIHMAHGYLLHEFFSPISNKRDDHYGGNTINRARLLLEIAKSLRKIWPKNKVLGARITGDDHLKNGIKSSESIYLVKELKKIGLDYVCVSSGGIQTKTNLKFYKGFRLNLSKKIKEKTKIKIRTTGLIDDINLANLSIKNKKCDFIAVGRKFLLDPHWIQKLNNLNLKRVPLQYVRGKLK